MFSCVPAERLNKRPILDRDSLDPSTRPFGSEGGSFLRNDAAPDARNTAAASQSGNYRFDINSEPHEEDGAGWEKHFEEAKWAITDK